MSNFTTFSNGVVIINVTPHAITFLDGETVVNVPPSGLLINAKVVEEVVETTSFITLVKSTFVGNDEGRAIIETIKAENPDVIIIGSIIAAQAYPGQVMGMISAVGFERVPPDQKRMRIDKFTTF